MQLLGLFGASIGLLATSAAHATVRPPRLVSDGMALQRDTPLCTGPASQILTVKFAADPGSTAGGVFDVRLLK